MRSFVVAFLFTITQFYVMAQESKLPEDIVNHLELRIQSKVNPSFSTAYINNGEVTFTNFGNTRLTNGVAVDKNTVYEIGSISKVFTTIILADEVLKGNMNLSDPVAKYLPLTAKIPEKNGKQITLKDLATHTSGLPRMPSNFNPKNLSNPFADYTNDMMFQFLADYQLPREVGASYEYSNLGMGLLAHILELHTSKSFEDLVIERIANPLGMQDTREHLTESMKSRLAVGHNDELKETANWDFAALSGAGALKSTVTDMVKFIKANFVIDDSDLSKAMQLSHKLAYENEDFSIGLGWHYSNNGETIWHNGGTGGYRAFAGFNKNTKQAVVILTNSVYNINAAGFNSLGESQELVVPKKVEYPDIVEVSDEVLESYVGKYQLTPAFFITITKKGKQLYGQATGQSEFELYPSSKTEFFLKVVEAKVSFKLDELGNVSSLVLHQGGQEIPGEKVE